MVGDRRAAIDIVERGLLIDAGNSELLELRRDLGERRQPMVPFLGRSNPINRMLGLLRHRLVGRRAQVSLGVDGLPAKPAAGKKPRGASVKPPVASTPVTRSTSSKNLSAGP
ncbi:MAG: hypothetical protein AAGD38_14350, partial [Acidobacteriota bacterium]